LQDLANQKGANCLTDQKLTWNLM